MPPLSLPEWLVVLTKSNFGAICVIICLVCTSAMVILEKILIHSGQFGRNVMGLLCVSISSAGMFFSAIIYRSAFNLGIGQGTPAFVLTYVHAVASVSALVTLVLAYRDMKKK